MMRAASLTLLGLLGLLVLAADAGAQPKQPAAPQTGTIKGKVTVTEVDGKTVDADVIVYVVGKASVENGPAQSHQIHQKDKKFVPDLLAITVNDRVSFPNQDKLLHNVFSPKPQFDVGTLRHGEGKDPLDKFKTIGSVDVYCNIHPEMAATILVLPNRHHVRARKDGGFELRDVPAGDWTLFAYTRRVKVPASKKITLAPGGSVSAELSLVRGPEAPHPDKFGGKYGGYSR
jgi:plastocyanin